MGKLIGSRQNGVLPKEWFYILETKTLWTKIFFFIILGEISLKSCGYKFVKYEREKKKLSTPWSDSALVRDTSEGHFMVNKFTVLQIYRKEL